MTSIENYELICFHVEFHSIHRIRLNGYQLSGILLIEPNYKRFSSLK